MNPTGGLAGWCGIVYLLLASTVAAQTIDLSNGLLQLSFDPNSRTWTLHERGMEDWQPVILNASASISFQGRDSLTLMGYGGEMATRRGTVTTAMGRAKTLEVELVRSDSRWTMTFALYDGKKALAISSTIENRSGSSWRMKSLQLIDAHGAGGIALSTDTVFMQTSGMLSSGRSGFAFLPSNSGTESYWSTMFVEPKLQWSLLAGFVTNGVSINSIVVEPLDRSSLLLRFSSVSDLATLDLQPSGKVESDTLLIALDPSPLENMRRFGEYQSMFAPRVNKPFTPTGREPVARLGLSSVPSGWISSSTGEDEHSEALTLRNLESAAKHLKAAGLRSIQIDRGYQIAEGDWSMNEKFPRGHRWLVDRIHANGFQAGLWIAPLTVSEHSTIFKRHRGWLLHDASGSLIEVSAFGPDSARSFCLDPTQPEVQSWLEKLFSRIVNEWGYDQVTIDLPSIPTDRVLFSKSVTTAEAYRKALRAIRRGVGFDKWMFGSSVPTGTAVGYIDGVQSDHEHDHGWNDVAGGTWHAAMQASKHNQLWFGNTGCLSPGKLGTTDQMAAAAGIAALTGQMNFICGPLTDLEDGHIAALRMTLPVHSNGAEPVDLFHLHSQIRTGVESGMGNGMTDRLTMRPGDSVLYELGGPDVTSNDRHPSPPRIWNLRVEKPFGRWNVVGVFNWSDEEAEITLKASECGLSPRKAYLVYEQWSDRFLGEITGTIGLTLRPASSQILAIHEKADRPIVLSTSRHVTQGAIDLANVEWERATATLSISSTHLLPGSYEVILYVPGKFELKQVVSRTRHEIVPVTEQIMKVRFPAVATDKMGWKLVFTRH